MKKQQYMEKQHDNITTIHGQAAIHGNKIIVVRLVNVVLFRQIEQYLLPTVIHYPLWATSFSVFILSVSYPPFVCNFLPTIHGKITIHGNTLQHNNNTWENNNTWKYITT